MCEVGADGGLGFNVNVPWPESRLGDADYLAAFELLVIPLLLAHSPHLVLVSAGFDSAEGEPQGDMRITPIGFGMLSGMVLDRLNVPTVFALEGGYCAPVTAACCEAVCRAVLGERSAQPMPRRLSRCVIPTLRSVIAAHQPYWPRALANAQEECDQYELRAASAVAVPERASKRRRGRAHD